MTEGSPSASERPAFEWGESAHALDDAWIYQRDFVGAMFRPSAEALLSQLPPRGRVLDAGCGTGAVALLAVEQLGGEGSVAGIDLNPAQLAVARTLDAEDVVDWHEGDVADLPYEDGSFDVVYCQHVLQFVPDRVAALRELRRVLAAGGRLGLAVWGPLERNPGFAAVADALRAEGDDETATIVGSPRVLADPDLVRTLVEEAGFADVEVRSLDVPVRVRALREFVDGLPPPLGDEATPAERERRRTALDAALERLEAQVGADGLAFDDLVTVAVGRAS